MKTRRILVGAVFSFLTAISLQAGQYFQDFSFSTIGGTSFGDGSQLFAAPAGVASVQDGGYKELQLTTNGTGSTRSAFMLPDLDPGTLVPAFSAKWNSQVLGDFTNAADGFSFNFGQLAPLNLINASYSQESGYPTGICFSVQTYVGNNPGFYLRINGAIVASQPFVPATQWGTNNTTRHFFEMDWNYANGVTVRMDGQTIFANVWTPGFTPQAGDRFVWAARTGLYSEKVSLDNIVVVTGGNLVPVAMTSPYYKSGENPPNETTDKLFDGSALTKWLTFATSGYAGATCASNSHAVCVYSLTSANDVPGRDPKNWTLEGSVNAGANWSTISTASGFFSNRSEQRAWLATNSAPFSAFRLNISANDLDANTQLAELSLYEFVPVELLGWVATAAPAKSGWNGVACSANLSKLLAVPSSFDGIYISTNVGQSWQKTSAPDNSWNSITCSTNGQVIAAVGSGSVTVSTNGGATWQQTLSQSINAVAISATGNRMIAVGFAGGWISGDYGATWTKTGISDTAYLVSVASSANGFDLYAVTLDGYVYRSGNSGGSWSSSGAVLNMKTVACSSDGQLVLIASGLQNTHSKFLRAVDSGIIYNDVSIPDQPWNSIAIVSGDYGMGSHKALAVSEGQTWTTSDSGASWTQLESPPGAAYLSAGATTRDGKTNLVAGTGGIWITGSLTPTQPAVTTGGSDNIDGSSARLSATINANHTPTLYWFEWGTTANYGNRTSAGGPVESGTAETVQLSATGLVALTTYHYRAAASNALGVVYGVDNTFTTAGGAPIIGTMTWQGGLGHVVLSGSVNPNYFATSARFDYAPAPLPLTNSTPSVDIGNGSSAVTFSQTIAVTPGATYQVRIVASGYAVTNGNIITFTAPTEDNFVETITALDPVQSSSMNYAASTIPTYATDNTAATKYLNFDKTNTFLIFQPTFTNRIVRALTLISAEDAPERDPASFVLDGSLDGTNFTRIASNAVPPFAGRNMIQSLPINNSSTFNFYRLTFPTVANPSAANSMQIAEIELLPYVELTSTNDVLSWTLPPGVSPVTTAAQLFDRSIADNGNKFEIGSITNDAIVDITLDAGPGILKGFELVGANDDASYPERMPTGISVAGSSDGTNFTTIVTRVPAAPTANMQLQEFSFSNNIAYAHYRVTIGRPTSGNRVQVGELRLFGVVPIPALSVRASGSNLLVCWPNAAGFNLETQTNLNQPNWIAVTNAPVLSNGVTTVTLPGIDGTRFFRLKK